MEALAPERDETVLEIGAGRGTLTDILRERAGRVVAIEYDRALAALLRERYAADGSVQIVEADVLKVDLSAVAAGPYALVGNVPYYITTPILFHALRRPRPERIVLLVQREVADRMSAAAGGKAYGALSVNVQALATVETVFRVPAGAFSPPPKVESAVVRVVPLADTIVAPHEEQGFRELVQAVFGMRRKQMRRVVRTLDQISAESAESLLGAAGIDPNARPETLTPRQFAALFRRLSAGG